MLSWRNVRIGTRIMLMATILFALIASLGAMSLWQMSRVHTNVEDFASNWLPSVEHLGDIQNLGNSARRLAFRHVLSTKDDVRQDILRQHTDIVSTQLPAAFKAYEAMIADAEERALYDKIRASWDNYLVAERDLIEASKGGEPQLSKARELADGPSNKAFLAFGKAVSDDIKFNVAGGEKARSSSADTYAIAKWCVGAAVLFSIAVGGAVAWAVTRSVTLPLAHAVDLAHSVAQGDLTTRIDGSGRDEVSTLMQSMAAMQVGLATIVGQVRSSSDCIATGSAQISAGNANLSERTEAQASSLQQAAATMEQLSGTISNNADNATQARQLAQGAAEVARRGGVVVGEVVTTMQGITESSRKIGDIIGVIDSIAFQTNILALNAAVEAARAGEQGRGFAVVASEVRGLARRSAEAAQEIKLLISNNVNQVEVGSMQVQAAGDTMQEIVSSIQRVSALVSEIATATVEQSNGVAQVGEAVSQMDRSTQQNAALVEQSAAAAESLKQQAADPVSAVAVFRLGAT